MGIGGLTVETDKPRRFAAFISYAHADAAIAAKLQSRLERYRLPKHLAESFAGGQTALGQIFRDREDLAAAPSLSDAIHAAIAEAEALIVICSPDAAASRWVGEEITLFRRLHPGKPVLAAVVRGEPEQAFPAALTEGGNEPLAADLRKEADGQTLGFLKIVAGIADVPLDALIQRDAQRRIRRVMWITGAAFAAMLVMGVMTTLAVQARNEAARQRTEAEGLVEYMLTDLRDKLKGVGRLDVMTAVNNRAMGYYDEQDIEQLTADSVLRRARIIEAMAADDEAAAKFGDAHLKYRKLHATTAALLKTEPANDQFKLNHANSENRLGLLFFSDQQFARSLPHFTKSRLILEKIKKSQRHKRDWRKLSSYVESNICGARIKLKYHDNTTLTFCRQAFEKSRNFNLIYSTDLNTYYDMIFDHAWYAEALAANGNKRLSRQLFQKTLDLLDKLGKKDPKNKLWIEQKMQIYLQIIKVNKRYNISVDHLNIKKEIIELIDALIKTDEKNLYWIGKRIEIMNSI